MSKIDNLIIYRLGMINESAVFDRYLKIPDPGPNVDGSLSVGLVESVQSGEHQKPPIEHHDHIGEVQRNFSILVEPGNNIYAVSLDPDIKCIFGPNAPPIGIFSADYYKDIVTEITSRSQEVLTFRIDYSHALAGLRGAIGEFWTDQDHSDEDGHHHPKSAQEVRNFAIPFFFNLYDKETNIPIWVLNNHDNSGHSRLKPRWHGKVHPNSNAYLIFE
jgi:hypothetical protein